MSALSATVTRLAHQVLDLTVLPAPPAYPTGETLRPLLTGDSVRDLHAAFQLHDDGKARQIAYDHAVRAGELQRNGAHPFDVFRALARAEGAAPEDTRPWHAVRLDAYTEALGIRGWYRRTDFRGHHGIVADILRLPADGDHGRHYVTRDFAPRPPLTHSVVDRDSGRTVYRAISGGIARQWLEAKEASS
ncbi:hypothetical protein ABZ208_35520 [Streptomyces sp. NPDC006208]|uniref:hypothetical protein n=1 Tax=Streptomyces sp. NPDC006208 TaxID=3156734 RepID=UPI0033ACF917